MPGNEFVVRERGDERRDAFCGPHGGRPLQLIGGVAVWALAVVVAMTGAAYGEALTYTLPPVPDRGCLDVELAWETAGRSMSALCVSKHWGAVADVPALLKDVRISGGLARRQESERWIVSHARGAVLRCRYTVTTGRRTFDWNSVHYPITTETCFHGIGNTFLLVPRAGDGGAPEDYDVIVRWKVPKSWKAGCSWGAGPTVGAHLKVDDLKHSVYLAGPLEMCTRHAAGADDVTIALLDGFGFDAAAFADLATGIIADQCAFMDEKAFPPFVVTAIPVGEPAHGGTSSMSGTGLYQSFALFLAPRATLTEGVEHLFAHELFHYWNGRVLTREEPEETTYWFSEGFTDYYALRILFESGRWNAETYAKWINRHLREYAFNPARNATNEDIRKGYWTQRDTVGEVPYQRGLLLGLRWQRLAREHGVPGGVDRLFKSLVERGRGGKFKLSNGAVREAGVRLLGEWFGADFDRYVTRAETIDVPADALAPRLVGEVTAVYAFALGFDRERSLKEKRVRGLVAGSAAAEAGLQEDDELAGWSIYGESDKEVQLKVRRDGQLETISYLPRGKQATALQFRPAEAAK